MTGIAAFVRKAQYVGRIDTSDPDIWILKFCLPEGKDAWAIWTAHEDDDWQVTLHSSQANPEPVLLCRVGNTAFERPRGTREWRRDAPMVPNEFSLLAGEMPWLVIGDLSVVRVASVQRRPFPELQRPVRGPERSGGPQ